MSTERIEELRREIDALDTQLLALLSRRAACALEVGQIKDARGEAIYQPAREALILARVVTANPGPLDGAAIRRVFERIIDEARRLERQAGRHDPGPGGSPGTVEST
ncbi:MAG TPA: chorismate mutase [Vicinamibacterales bacterium]|nr:chorismate mutase [Vicinamibacterales bacterium]